MKKPKTLNQLSKEADELSFGGYTIDTLKDEAVKWVKFLGTTTEDENPEENVAISEWIMHFFNLTEKDLKNG
jgi:hypothetical protein